MYNGGMLAVVARQSHKLYYGGSIPSPATIKNQNAAQQGVYFGYPEHSAKLQTISGMNWFTKPLRMSFLRVASFIVKDVNN